MARQPRQRRTFSGMSYRDVQRSNSTRKRQLPKTLQKQLKDDGYKNVGWDHVIRLYQKINELQAGSEEDELSLEELFLQADRIGQKYQTAEEIETFKQQLGAEVTAISAKIDEHFPDEELEAIDYRAQSRTHSRQRRTRGQSR